MSPWSLIALSSGPSYLETTIIMVFVPILEELGWRGYGVDSLTSRFNLFNSRVAIVTSL